ncbi:MAG: hypothetical protein ACIAQ0_11255 [Phycisphaerales bacterium JB058]
MGSEPNHHDELSRYLSPERSETELYELLAESAGLGADEINKESEGRELFSRVWRQKRDTVCADKKVRAYIGDPTTSDASMIAAHLLGLLSPIDGLNVAILAALWVRIGLRQLCAKASAGGD